MDQYFTNSDIIFQASQPAQDAFYRYSIPKLCIQQKFQKKLRQIVISNISKISTIIKVAPEYIIEFLALETQSNGQIINQKGSIVGVLEKCSNADNLQNIFEKLVQQYLQCTRCDKINEIVLIVQNEKVYQYHMCCGQIDEMDDMNSTFTVFMKKNGQYQQKLIKKDLMYKQIQTQLQEYLEYEQECKIRNTRHAECENLTLQQLKTSYNQQKNVDNNIKDKLVQEFAKILQNEDKIDERLYLYLSMRAILSTEFIPEICDQSENNIISILIELAKLIDLSEPEQDFLFALQNFICYDMQEQKCDQYIATLLKHCYDKNLLTEDFLLSWNKDNISDMQQHILYNKKFNYFFKIQAAPFLNWLQQDEVEDDQETSQEDDQDEQEEIQQQLNERRFMNQETQKAINICVNEYDSCQWSNE